MCKALRLIFAVVKQITPKLSLCLLIANDVELEF